MANQEYYVETNGAKIPISKDQFQTLAKTKGVQATDANTLQAFGPAGQKVLQSTLGFNPQEESDLLYKLQYTTNPTDKNSLLQALQNLSTKGAYLPQSIQDQVTALPPKVVQQPTTVTGPKPGDVVGPKPIVEPPISGIGEPPSAGYTVTNPAGGIDVGGAGPAQKDVDQLLKEAELQKSLSTQTAQEQADQRQQQLSNLANLLATQQAKDLKTEMPGIYEDLNTRGLLRSSALGTAAAREAAKLSAQTSTTLGQQAIANTAQSTADLGNIEGAYQAARNSALGRQFSIEDYLRQLEGSKQLGAIVNPVQPSGKGAGALKGGLGGAAIGGQFGGPTGAIVGGVTGLLGGGAMGGKA